MFNFNRTRPAAQSGAKLSSKVSPTRSSIIARLLVLILLTFAAPQAAHTQVLYGSLTGDVTDQKRASVPGVRVEARDVGTGITKEATTDGNGGYQLGGLQPGTYNVTFALASFKTVIQENVKVEANAIHRLDVELQVGEVAESVVVTQ